MHVRGQVGHSAQLRPEVAFASNNEVTPAIAFKRFDQHLDARDFLESPREYHIWPRVRRLVALTVRRDASPDRGREVGDVLDGGTGPQPISGAWREVGSLGAMMASR